MACRAAVIPLMLHLDARRRAAGIFAARWGILCAVSRIGGAALCPGAGIAGMRCAFQPGMRFVIALFLAAHGIAHLVGFVASWKVAVLDELPYKTTVLAGRIDVGDAGARVFGVFWLLAAAAFVAAGGAVALQAGWAFRFTAVAVVASLLLCVAGWPEARIGAGVNFALLVLLAIVAGKP